MASFRNVPNNSHAQSAFQVSITEAGTGNGQISPHFGDLAGHAQGTEWRLSHDFVKRVSDNSSLFHFLVNETNLGRVFKPSEKNGLYFAACLADFKLKVYSFISR
jgi:hypothetical protein